MAEHATIVRILSGRAAAGREAELLAAIRPAVEWLGARDGCFGAQACRLREEPATLAVVSRWRDQAALDAALQSDEYRQVTAPAMNLVEGAPAAVHYTSTG